MSGGEGEALRRSKKREHDTGKNPNNRRGQSRSPSESSDLDL